MLTWQIESVLFMCLSSGTRPPTQGEICLVIWVERKLSKSLLEPDKLLPEAIEGIPVDITEGELFHSIR